MHRILTVLFAALIAPMTATAAWSADIIAASDAIPDQYIVILKHEQFSQKTLTRSIDRRQQVRDIAWSVASQQRRQPGRIYTDSLYGFSVTMSNREARKLARDPRVAYIAEDSWAQASATNIQFDPPSWGLDRIDQRESELDGRYEYNTVESAVRVYVIDSGIRSTHQDFGARIDTFNAFTAYTDGHGTEDCHGHGTHVAGVIGGDLHGVAKNVSLHPVRVLNCWAGGPISAVIAGVDWVTAQVNDNPHAAVANMSLIASPSQALDDAVRASIAAGVTYVVAAGNNGASACDYSPARVAEAITIGATTPDDLRVLSSNYGECVDLYAPGAGIRSTFNRSDTDTTTMTGTSAAAPHVAGIAAQLLGQAPSTLPSDIADIIIANATQTGNSFLPDASDLLAFGLIELGSGDGELEPAPEPAPEPVPEPVPEPAHQIEFTDNCQPAKQRCAFRAIVTGNKTAVQGYHWDFGDGNASSAIGPMARHYYATGGTVTVILAVELATGDIVVVDREIHLSFKGARRN